MKAVMVQLQESWPLPLAFDTLFESARARLTSESKPRCRARESGPCTRQTAAPLLHVQSRGVFACQAEFRQSHQCVAHRQSVCPSACPHRWQDHELPIGNRADGRAFALGAEPPRRPTRPRCRSLGSWRIGYKKPLPLRTLPSAPINSSNSPCKVLRTAPCSLVKIPPHTLFF